MPKKQAKSNQNWKQIEFVNIQLDIKQKKEFRSWYETMAAEAETLLDNHIKSGYKISIRYDEENETFISSSTCVDEGLSNHDKCLTSRSDVLVEALLLNIYKTDVVCKDGVWEADTSSQKWG